MHNLGEDDVSFLFLSKEEKEKLDLSFRGCSAENSARDFSSRLLYTYTDSLYVVLSLHEWKLTLPDQILDKTNLTAYNRMFD